MVSKVASLPVDTSVRSTLSRDAAPQKAIQEHFDDYYTATPLNILLNNSMSGNESNTQHNTDISNLYSSKEGQNESSSGNGTVGSNLGGSEKERNSETIILSNASTAGGDGLGGMDSWVSNVHCKATGAPPSIATTDSTRSPLHPETQSWSPTFSSSARPEPNESTLSLRDLFECTNATTTIQDTPSEEYYLEEEDDAPYPDDQVSSHNPTNSSLTAMSRKDHLDITPPSSLHLGALTVQGAASSASPSPFHLQRQGAASPASDAAGSLTVASSAETGSVNRRPVLYSAIGSLEDPSNSSYSQWKNRQVQKFDFPSSQLLIPPSKTKKTKRSLIADAHISPIDETKSAPSKPIKEIKAKAKEPSPKEIRAAVAKQVAQVPPPIGDDDDTPTMGQSHKKPSNLRSSTRSQQTKVKDGNKKVTIEDVRSNKKKPTNRRKAKKPVEMFRPSSDAYTPRMEKKKIEYRPAEKRASVEQMASGLGTLSRPNFRDALRRVAMIIRQHIVKIENRFEHRHQSQMSHKSTSDGLFYDSMKDQFCEEKFITPTYKCTMVRVPMARSGMVYGLRRIKVKYEVPTEAEIYEFGHQLFHSVQLSSECSIVCLIYVERLMEVSKVPLLASTWRPIFMCGLLLASKVWQDLSSWNIEFASVYPQYSLESINALELQFLRMVKWDLYISTSLYAKYYFALRSLTEKKDFRQRYNRMVGGIDKVQASEALKVERGSTHLKETAISQLSRSM